MPDTYTPNLSLKKPGYDSPADIKDLNDNFDKIDTSVNQLSQQMASYRTAVNLLDNSDFRNPVNQRNIPYGSTGDAGYKIDRWKYENGGQGGDTSTYFGFVKDTYISLYPPSDGYVQLSQNLERYEAMKGKTYTFAMRVTYRGVPQTIAVSFVMGGVPNGLQLVADSTIRLFSVDGYNLLIRLHGNMGTKDELAIAWAALYEGSYTADNLPPYVPKGYAMELAACQRYLPVAIITGEDEFKSIGAGAAISETEIKIVVPVPTSPRATPIISCEGISALLLRGGSFLVPTAVSVDISSMNAVTITCTVSGAVVGAAYELIATPGVKLLLLSEL